MIKQPVLIIPKKNLKEQQRQGGGKPPRMFIDKAGFEGHKVSRVKEIDKIIEHIKSIKPRIKAPHDQIFFGINLNKKALSKSAQPKELFDSYNMDILERVDQENFVVTTQKQYLESFRDSTSKFNLKDNRHESAYLSAVSQIDIIDQKKIVGFDKLPGGKFTGFIYIYDVFSPTDVKNILKELNRVFNLNLIHLETESKAKVLYGELSSKIIHDVSVDTLTSPISRIEKSLEFVLPKAISIPMPKTKFKLSSQEYDSKVAVVDTGIGKNPIITKYIIDDLDFNQSKSGSSLDKHGTFVASRIIFGNEIEDQIHNGLLTPKSKVLDIKVFGKKKTNDKLIVESLRKVVNNPKYTDIKIFNLSLGNDNIKSVIEGKKCYLTRELDNISYNHNILFIISAGNQGIYWDTHHSLYNKFPECLFATEATISPPADVINGISVGSIADIESTKSISQRLEPSPFSRTGLLEGKIKPELTHFGGNLDIYGNQSGIGVKGLSIRDDELLEDVGTSHSTPLVSSIAGQIYAYLDSLGRKDQREKLNLTKALLIHSSNYTLPQESEIPADDIKRVVGFGIPDFSRALDCTKSNVTYIFTGEMHNYKTGKLKKNKNKITFSVPDELKGKNKKVKIRGTLVYTPKINSIDNVEYSMSNISINLKYYNSRGRLVNGALTKGNNYRHKWYPVKHFEKSLNAYESGEWEIWLELNTRGEINDSNYTEQYTLVISIEDISPDPQNRVELYQIVRNKYKQYNTLEIQEKIRVR
jgi:hypothetical protein